MRSLHEIAFRLRQEVANAWMLLRPPRLTAPLTGSLAMPTDIEQLAPSILEHRFPLLGMEIEAGPEIEWRRDYVHGVSTGTQYFRRVPYLDFRRVGDHKIIWELNRHQHLVALAQTGRPECIAEIEAQLDSWLRANPFLRGINWTSALEVAFRAISWLRVHHLVGLQSRIHEALYRHGCYLEHNLSIYFSPNTHLLGEAVALHALGLLFGVERWRKVGADLVVDAMARQVRDDGSHFEQSSYYHVYALDFFRLHDALAPTSPAYKQKLERMAEYLGALRGPSDTLPLIGDDDGGHMFRSREIPAEPRSQFFADAGIAVMTAGGVHVIVDAGAFGAGSGGHSHSDTLSVIVRSGREEILVDAGTYTYVADPSLRNWFRGSAAHNTIRVDGLDQADPVGPFRWKNPPSVQIREYAENLLDAVCEYRGISHRRRVRFVKPDLILVLDEVTGPPGVHDVEQFWHPGETITELEKSRYRIGERAVLTLDPRLDVQLIEGWRSKVFGQKSAAQAIHARQSVALPVRWAAALDLSGDLPPDQLLIQCEHL